ncbi:hypothetical protein LOB98_05445 [Lactobacillus delbrueckii subsp. lactis]|nr:hypothetical protein [Lactobacillus delbrueckii]MCD5533567.1 hypothetical protein [Lactobacillus delbrueckii subsp. lactis]
MPGTKNMGIYAKVTKKGASKKVTTTKYFKYSKIQSTASKKTKKGYELIETVCEEHNVDIEIINQTDDISYEEELTEDVLEIITVFSAKLYGKRSHRNEQIVAENRKLFSKDDKKETKDSN